MADKNQLDIVLGDRKISVHILRVRDSAKVERMREAAAATPSSEADDQILREYFYPVLSITSTGDVPTEEEFLDMPLHEANVWLEAVNKLNPGSIPGLDAETEEEEAEKKES